MGSRRDHELEARRRTGNRSHHHRRFRRPAPQPSQRALGLCRSSRWVAQLPPEGKAQHSLSPQLRRDRPQQLPQPDLPEHHRGWSDRPPARSRSLAGGAPAERPIPHYVQRIARRTAPTHQARSGPDDSARRVLLPRESWHSLSRAQDAERVPSQRRFSRTGDGLRLVWRRRWLRLSLAEAARAGRCLRLRQGLWCLDWQLP